MRYLWIAISFILLAGSTIVATAQTVQTASVARSRYLAKSKWRQSLSTINVATQSSNVTAAGTNLANAKAEYEAKQAAQRTAKQDVDEKTRRSDQPAILAAKETQRQADLEMENAKQTLDQATASLKGALNAVYATATLSDESLPCYKEGVYRWWLPVWRPACQKNPQEIVDFFGATSAFEKASTVQYLYNSTQSASQLSSDLLTASFQPGFQAIFGANITNGSTQPAATTPASQLRSADSSGTPAQSTDDVATAISKLQGGGDFNVRLPMPLVYFQKGPFTQYTLFSPTVGFTVNGLTSQTITEANDYSAAFPLEFYFEEGSIEKVDGHYAGRWYADFRGGENIVSPDYAQKVGLKHHTYLSGQAAAGIQFSQNIRVGVQYYLGASNTFTDPNNKQVGKFGGLHFVISYAPQK